MFPILPVTAVPEGALIAVGMDWGEHSAPSLTDLEELWPEHAVSTFPAGTVQVSNAIIWTREPTTGQRLLMPLYRAGVKRALAFRFERVPTTDKEPPTIEGSELLEELKRFARAFAVPGFILKDPKPGEEPFLSSPKKIALALGLVAGTVGLVLIVLHFAR